MSERYLITGAQIGLLRTGIDNEKVLKEIEDQQFLGHSLNSVVQDADMIFNSGLYAPTKTQLITTVSGKAHYL
jgi:hypothetical protein